MERPLGIRGSGRPLGGFNIPAAEQSGTVSIELQAYPDATMSPDEHRDSSSGTKQIKGLWQTCGQGSRFGDLGGWFQSPTLSRGGWFWPRRGVARARPSPKNRPKKGRKRPKTAQNDFFYYFGVFFAFSGAPRAPRGKKTPKLPPKNEKIITFERPLLEPKARPGPARPTPKPGPSAGGVVSASRGGGESPALPWFGVPCFAICWCQVGLGLRRWASTVKMPP